LQLLDKNFVFYVYRIEYAPSSRLYKVVLQIQLFLISRLEIR